MAAEDEGPYVELLQTHDLAELGLAKSILASADIPFLVDGETSLGLFPLTTPGFFGKRGLGAVVRVRREDLEEARALLEEAVAQAPEEGPEEGTEEGPEEGEDGEPPG